MSLTALECLKQVIFFQLFPTIFIEKKKTLISYILIMLSPPPLLPDPPHLPISIPFLSLQNKNPRNTHTNAHKNTSENKQADEQ